MSQQPTDKHRRLLTSSDEVERSPDYDTIPIGNIKTSSRRSMGPPMELKKSIYELEVNNAGVTSESATSPKYQDMMELLNRHGSSIDSVEGGLINETRSPASQQLEETQMLLRRKQLDYEKLINEFDHSKARWELERQDLELAVKDLNSKTSYLQEVIRGLKAQGVCRDALMTKMIKIDKPSQQGYKNLIDQYKRASEDLRETMQKRDSQLTAARQSDHLLKNRVQKLTTQKQDSDRHSSRIPSKTVIEKNQILIEDQDTTLSSLKDCFQKLKKQNGQFRRILTGFRNQRLQNRRRGSANNHIIKFDMADPSESLRRQLSFTQDKLREFQKNRQNMCKELEKQKNKIDEMKRQLEKQIATHQKSKQQLELFKCRAQQLQNSIDQLSSHIEQIAKTNDQLCEQANRVRGDKMIAQTELLSAKIRIQQLQKFKQLTSKQAQDKIASLEQLNLIQKLTFQQRISTLQSQLGKQQSSIISQLRQQVSDLMAHQEQLSQEIFQKTLQYGNLQQNLNKKNEQAETIKAELRAAEQNNQELQKQLQLLKSRLHALANEQIPALKEKIEQLNGSNVEKQNKLAGKIKQLNQLQSQLNFANGQCTRKQQQIDRMSKELGDVENRLTNEIAQIDRLVQQINRLEAQKLLSEHQKVDLEDNVKMLEFYLKERDDKIKEKQLKIQELIKQRQHFSETQTQKLSQLQQLLAKKQQQIDNQRGSSLHLSSDLAVKATMLKEMEDKCRNIEQEMSNMEQNQQKKLKIAQDQLEAARLLIQQQNNIIAASMKNEQFKQLMDQYKVQRQENDKMRQSIMHLHQQLQRLNDKVQQSDNLINQKQSKIQELQKQTQQLNNLADKLNALQQQLEQQREITAKLNNTTQQLQQLNERHNKDQTTLTELQLEIEQLRQDKLRMQVQIQQLCVANQQQLIHIKDEYKASLAINEQLRAAIILMKNQSQPTLQLSSIAHGQKGSMLEGIPQEMLKVTKDHQQASFLQDTVDDHKQYEEEIDRLVNQLKDKNYFDIVNEMAHEHKSLYSEVMKDKLIEAFKKTVNSFKSYIDKEEERRENIKKKAVAFSDTAEMIMSKSKIEAPKSERSEKSDKVEKLDDKSGSSSVRLKKTALHKENNQIDQIFKRQQTQEDMVLSVLELKMKGEKSPQELSQTSLNRSQIKSQISEAQKADIKHKIDAANMRTHLNAYRKTSKKPTKK